MSHPATPLLSDALWPVTEKNKWVRSLFLVLAGSLLIALSARIQAPMWPVPMTMQTFAVLFLGLVAGPRIGAGAVLAYLIQGMSGLPVFAAGGGAQHLVGPTGGYLIGFLPAAYAVGWLAQQGWGLKPIRVMLAMLVGSAIIYLFGAGWLSTLIGLEKAVLNGVAPFLVGDVVKAALAALLAAAGWRGALRERTWRNSRDNGIT